MGSTQTQCEVPFYPCGWQQLPEELTGSREPTLLVRNRAFPQDEGLLLVGCHSTGWCVSQVGVRPSRAELLEDLSLKWVSARARARPQCSEEPKETEWLPWKSQTWEQWRRPRLQRPCLQVGSSFRVERMPVFHHQGEGTAASHQKEYILGKSVSRTHQRASISCGILLNLSQLGCSVCQLSVTGTKDLRY